MSMVCGLDLHRGQITFDALELESGEVWRGRLWQPDRERFRRWVVDEAVFAVIRYSHVENCASPRKRRMAFQARR